MRRWIMSLTAAALISSAAAGAADAAVHTVQKGDTLYKIAQQYNVSVTELKSWNKLTTDSIFVNQPLQIGSDTQTAAGPGQNQGTAANTYKVQKGESLYSISRKFSVTIVQLTEWNRLKSPVLQVGQILKVKEDAPEPTSPIVAPKEPVPVNPVPVETAPLTGETGSTYAAVLSKAMSVQGTPYVFGGSTPAGFDCSGFIHYVYSQAGLSISRQSSEGYFNSSTTVASPVPGDLVFFENTYKPGISHMGIYIGNNSFIHSASRGVEIGSLNVSYWKDRFVGFKRLNAVAQTK